MPFMEEPSFVGTSWSPGNAGQVESQLLGLPGTLALPLEKGPAPIPDVRLDGRAAAVRFLAGFKRVTRAAIWFRRQGRCKPQIINEISNYCSNRVSTNTWRHGICGG